MAAGYPGRDLRGSFDYLQFPYPHPSNGRGSNNFLKRSLSEFEQQQQQIQNALYLRSVKQRTHLFNCPIDLSSSSSISSSSGVNFLVPQQQTSNISNPCFGKKSAMKDKLQELERQLLLDDDEDDDISVTGSSTVTTTDWGEAMQQLISLSPSPSTLPSPPLTSSTSSSSSSCSPAPPTSSKQLLLETAAAISEGNLETATSNLAVLKRSANPRGDPDQRLTTMMVQGLMARINPPPVAVTAASPIADLCSLEHQTATQMLYDVSPCFKLGLLAANFAILDAKRDQLKIHIVDFDLGQGLQYASLINSIAGLSYNRPVVKITAVCEPTFLFNTINTPNNLIVIGDKIVRLAERFNVEVQFNVLNRRTKEINRTVLGCEPGDLLAVNLAFVLSRIADESVTPANPRDELLRQVKSLEPNIVTIVEQEMNGNTAPFSTRFKEACSYYGSILESLDTTSNRETPNRENLDRVRVESCLARKATNNIAREGAERLERPEVFGKWRARMSMAGFKPVQFGPGIVEPVKARFGSMKSNPGFTLKEENGGVGFGWMGRVLTMASSWR